MLLSVNDSLFEDLHIHHISLDENLNSYCYLYGVYGRLLQMPCSLHRGARNVFDGLNIHHIEGMAIHYNMELPLMWYPNSRFRFCGGNCMGFFAGTSHSDLLIYNNILSENRHGETFPDSGNMIQGSLHNSKIYNNTIYSAFNSGVRLGGNGNEFRNNIVVNTDESFTVIEGSHTFSNNLTSNPNFVNPSAGDFHLQSSSPARDAGVSLSEVPCDADNNARPAGGAYDIGAYSMDSSPGRSMQWWRGLSHPNPESLPCSLCAIHE